MRARLAICAAALLWLAAPANAHRLDEYLQATTIAVEKDHLALQLRLTPGVGVAPKVLAGIDANGDGTISESEQQAYVKRVRDDLSLTLDGSPQQLRLISASFSKMADMTQGLGDILLRFKVDVHPGDSPRTHSLTFGNHHQSLISVYLVNCLKPHDADIRITEQDRNYDQSFYRLDFTLGNAPSSPQAADGPVGRANAFPTVETYFWHGIRHILTGYDHLLFIGALVFAATTLWDLVKVITAFTLAHSITLTLAAMDLVHLSSRIVEPLISASIVFVALQNLFWPKYSRGRSRLVVAFFFGLFHGLGFAGGLLDIMHQMPKTTVLLAILGFSAGVEAGNQMVLLPLFGLLKGMRRLRQDTAAGTRLSQAFRRIGSAGVSVAGVYYLCVALAGKA